MRCTPCAFGFADPFVAGTKEFYGLEAPDTPYPTDKWEYQRSLQECDKIRDNGTKLLDVGAGKGHFLSHLLQHGWTPRQLFATEYSISGMKSIQGLGVSCAQTDIRNLDHADHFNVICMFQVLEHLDGYDALFGAIDRLTQPRAHLFIAVPNGARIDFNEAFGLQDDCPPNHLSRWSPRSFNVLAAKYGWVVAGCEMEPPASLRQEAAYGAVNRYIRNSHRAGSWARLTYGWADRAFARSGKANKMAKALGMATSPDCWMAATRVVIASRGRGVPHALWVHLRRG